MPSIKPTLGCGLLDLVRSKNKEDRFYVNSYWIHSIADSGILLLSYELIKFESSNISTVLNNSAINVDKTSFLFRRNKYKFFPSHQSNITKAKGKSRPTRVDYKIMSLEKKSNS